MSHDEDTEPSWLDEVNDENHSLLFGGSANPSLQGGDEEEQSQRSRKSYGATARDDDDDDVGKTAITEFSHASSAKKSDASDDDDEIQGGNKSQEPRRNVVLAAFNFIEGFGIVASVSLLLTQLLPLFFAFSVNQHGITDLVLKFYISIFCILFILVENDTPIPFIKNSTILQNYFSRGFVYSFIGVVSILPHQKRKLGAVSFIFLY